MPAKARLLIVDDEPNTLASLSRAFRLAGHEAVVCDTASRALQLATSEAFDVIFSDVVMPNQDGLWLLEQLKSHEVQAPVIMMSGQAHVQMAVKATRLGALDFLEKPLSTEKLLLAVDNALKLKRLEQENQRLRRLDQREIVWSGPAMQRIMTQIERVAPTESRICILGETGTGKELVARTIHDRSPRANAPFVAVNCAAVPAELIESELFGHEKGAFTGATGRHTGKFEQANGGTLFLDEIGDMPLGMQAKLLRVLEQAEVERVGGSKPVPVDVRVLVATHRSLSHLVSEGKFREDLFHRVYVFPIMLPPLRERREDIPALVEHFAQAVTEQNNWKPVRFTPDAVTRLQQYQWPGNVRELRNVVERAMLLALQNEVDATTVELALPRELSGGTERAGGNNDEPLAKRMEGYERDTIISELRRHQFQMTNTARALGLERSHLYKKCEQLGIDLSALKREQAGGA
jgi:DNA-binding NtrC family response regulator